MPGTSPGNIFTWKTIIAGLFYQLVVRAVFQTKGQIGSFLKLQKVSRPPVSCPELTSKQFLRTAFLPNLPGWWNFQNQVLLPLITLLGRNSFCLDLQSAKAGRKWMSAFMLQQPLLLCRFDLFYIQLWSILLSTLHILSSAIYKRRTMRSARPQCTRLTKFFIFSLSAPALLHIITQHRVLHILTQREVLHILTQNKVLHIFTQHRVLHILTQRKVLHILT